MLKITQALNTDEILPLVAMQIGLEITALNVISHVEKKNPHDPPSYMESNREGEGGYQRL